MKNRHLNRSALLQRVLMFGLAFFLIKNACAQCSYNSLAYDSCYKLQKRYVPYTTNNPLITLKITLHVFYYTDLAGMHGIWLPTNSGFNGTPGLQNALSAITNDNRDRYSDPIIKSPGYTAPNWPPAPLSDSRIRYEVTNIYYYNSKTMTEYDGFTNGFYGFENYIDDYPGRLEEGLPVIINTGSQHFGYAGSMNSGPAIVTQADANTVFGFRENLIHELGHALGLMHIYYGDGDTIDGNGGYPGIPSFSPETPSSAPGTLHFLDCSNPDYLSDVFPINNPQSSTFHAGIPPASSCNSIYEFDGMATNNIMSGCSIGDPSFQYHGWISPLQMGRRIRNMHLKTFNNIRKYAKEMISDHQHPWNITTSSWNPSGNETWDFDIQMYEDIVVKSGHTLTIKCKVAMATDGKIIVEKGAKLIIDGGEVTGWCKKTPAGSSNGVPLWTGIEIHGDPSQNQLINNTTGYCANQGIVEIKNQGVISYAQKGINTSRTNNAGNWINNTSGGIVIANDGIFLNNVFDIIFYKYHTGNVRSKIENSLFMTNAPIGYDVNNVLIYPKEHIKLYDNWGLNIKGCYFYGGANVYPMPQRGVGIYATDSHFTVDDLNQVASSVFTDLREGVYIDNGNPIYTAVIQNSDFVGNATGVKVENCNYLSVRDNVFTVPSNGVGTYLYKSKYYKIRNNTFNGTSLQDQGSGIVAYDSYNGAHEIYRNSFSDLYVGILAEDNNGGSTVNSTGLKMNCNVFANAGSNLFDIALMPVSGIPVIMTHQSPPSASSANDYVNNFYGAQNYGYGVQNKFYVDPSNTQNIVHQSSQSGPDNPSPLSSPQVLVNTNSWQFNYGSSCPANTTSGGGNPLVSSSDNLNVMNDYLVSLQEDEDNDNKYEIQATVAAKLGIFLTDTMPGGNDSIIAILSANQGHMADADIQNIFALMRSDDYTLVGDAIDAIAGDKPDWASVLTTLVDLKLDSSGIENHLGDPNIIGLLEDLAANEDGDGQACAEAVLEFAGLMHAYPVILPTLEQAGGKVMQVENLQNLPGQAISVYPNPTQNGITIDNLNTDKGNLKIEVLDVLGKLVLSKTVDNAQQYLSLNELNNGMYLLKVTDDKNAVFYQTKVVKQN